MQKLKLRSAKIASDLFNPVLIAFFGDIIYIFVGLEAKTLSQITRLSIFPILHALLPSLILLFLIKVGKVSDYEITKKHERTGFFTALLGCFAIATILSTIQTEYFILNLATTVTLAIIILINTKWKISVHTAFDTLIFGSLAVFVDWRFIFLLLLLPLIAWSRVVLKKHSTKQTIGGVLLASSILTTLVIASSYLSNVTFFKKYFNAIKNRTNSIIFERIETAPVPLETTPSTYIPPITSQTNIEINIRKKPAPVQQAKSQTSTTSWWSYPQEILPVQEDPNSLIVVVNKKYKLPDTYAPPDLVSLGSTGLRYGDQKIGRAVMLDDLTKMAKAASDSGIDLAIKSSYRSYAQQVTTYNYWVSKEGGDYNKADKYSARPGHSEHQLGTAIDFTTNECGDCIGSGFTGTKAQKWLAQNALDFGFYLSYPAGQESITGYAYESWHYRYKGQ